MHVWGHIEAMNRCRESDEPDERMRVAVVECGMGSERQVRNVHLLCRNTRVRVGGSDKITVVVWRRDVMVMVM